MAEYDKSKYTIKFRNGKPTEQGSMIVFGHYYGSVIVPYLMAVRTGTNNASANAIVSLGIGPDGSNDQQDWLVSRPPTPGLLNDDDTVHIAATFVSSAALSADMFAGGFVDVYPVGASVPKSIRFDFEANYGGRGSRSLLMTVHGKALLGTTVFDDRAVYPAYPNPDLPEHIFCQAPGGRGLQPSLVSANDQGLATDTAAFANTLGTYPAWPYQSDKNALTGDPREDYIEFSVNTFLAAGSTITVIAPNGQALRLVRNSTNNSDNKFKASITLSGQNRDLDADIALNNDCWNTVTAVNTGPSNRTPVSGTWTIIFTGIAAHGDNVNSATSIPFTMQISGKRFTHSGRAGGLGYGVMLYDWRTNTGQHGDTFPPSPVVAPYRNGLFNPTAFGGGSHTEIYVFETGLASPIVSGYVEPGGSTASIQVFVFRELVSLAQEDYLLDVYYAEGAAIVAGSLVKTVPFTDVLAGLHSIEGLPYNPRTGGSYRVNFRYVNYAGNDVDRPSPNAYFVPPTLPQDNNDDRSEVLLAAAGDTTAAGVPDSEGGFRYYGVQSLKTKGGNFEQFKRIFFAISDLKGTGDDLRNSPGAVKLTRDASTDYVSTAFYVLVRPGATDAALVDEFGRPYFQVKEGQQRYMQAFGERRDGTFSKSAISRFSYNSGFDVFGNGSTDVAVDFFVPRSAGVAQERQLDYSHSYTPIGDIEQCTVFDGIVVKTDDAALPLTGEEIEAAAGAIVVSAPEETNATYSARRVLVTDLPQGTYQTVLRGKTPSGRKLFSTVIRMYVYEVPVLPVVAVASVATDIDSDSATLNGVLLNTGSSTTPVSYRFRRSDSLTLSGQLASPEIYPTQTAELAAGASLLVSQDTGDTLNNVSVSYYDIEVL